jgi:hypothetical protein
MAVSALHPKISIRLHKVIGRETVGGAPASVRFRGSARTIDLTPFLGEQGSVRTSKNIREAAGGFSITLADKMFSLGAQGQAQMESLYGLIEPMDVIVIRMAHEPHKYQGKGLPDNLPIVMRGFVSKIQRVEGVSEDGKPQRSVVISGQDYGKILQIMQIIYFPNYVLGQNLLTNFRLFVNYGSGFTPNQPAGQFVGDVINKVVNPYLQQLASRSGSGSGEQVSSILPITVESTVQRGTVSPFGLNTYQGGTIHQMLTYFGDVGPFNELFIEDREDVDGGVVLVYRPNPFASVNGTQIQGGAAPAVARITDKEVAGLNSERTDANIANYYWVDAPRYQLNNPEILRLTASSGDEATFLLADYPNSTPNLYGIRKMEVATQQGDTAEQTRQDAQPLEVSEEERDRGIDWLTSRRQTLIDQNKDNVLFETGNMLLRGNESIRAGMTVRLKRREVEADYYAVSVDHSYGAFGSFTTTVQFERGRGFIERVLKEQAPYLAEMNTGGVYDG